MKYTNCPTCGSLCKLVPQPPKEPIRLDVVTDYDKDKIFLLATREVNTHQKNLEQFLDSIPLDDLYNYLMIRVKFPNGRPISWSDLFQ